jgi:pimeloyl-ACP methyl ester carboxylesterase
VLSLQSDGVGAEKRLATCISVRDGDVRPTKKRNAKRRKPMMTSKMPRFGLGSVVRFLMAGAGLIGLAAAQTPQVVKNIVLVHGAWADGSSWDKVVPLLEAKGYHVIAVHEPLTSLADDVAATNRAIDAQSGPVLLVGHSWGGAVITEAGNNEKVLALVYVDAFALDEGESVNGLTASGKPPAWVAKIQVDRGGFLTLPTDVIFSDFAQDLPPAQARLLAVKQGPLFSKSLDDKITMPAWKSKPSWYVRGTEDHIIDPAAQAAMAKRMGATVIAVASSHVSMLSHASEVAAVIDQAASGVSTK